MVTSSESSTVFPIQFIQVTCAVYSVVSVGHTSKSGELLITVPVVLFIHSKANVSVPVASGANRQASSVADQIPVFLPGAVYPSVPPIF